MPCFTLAAGVPLDRRAVRRGRQRQPSRQERVRTARLDAAARRAIERRRARCGEHRAGVHGPAELTFDATRRDRQAPAETIRAEVDAETDDACCTPAAPVEASARTPASFRRAENCPPASDTTSFGHFNCTGRPGRGADAVGDGDAGGQRDPRHRAADVG